MDNQATVYSDYLTLNCQCFKNEITFPTKKPPRKLCDYVIFEKQRCLAIHEEANKHIYFDVQDMKPCYGVSTTTAMILRSSLLRHLNTIKKLTTVVKKNPSDMYIKFENGKEISVSSYTQTVKQAVEAKINTLTNFNDHSSPVIIGKLTRSEKYHNSTLTVLENVIKSIENGFNQLEISIESPQ
jgi:hypothetical protein